MLSIVATESLDSPVVQAELDSRAVADYQLGTPSTETVVARIEARQAAGGCVDECCIDGDGLPYEYELSELAQATADRANAERIAWEVAH